MFNHKIFQILSNLRSNFCYFQNTCCFIVLTVEFLTLSQLTQLQCCDYCTPIFSIRCKYQQQPLRVQACKKCKYKGDNNQHLLQAHTSCRCCYSAKSNHHNRVLPSHIHQAETIYRTHQSSPSPNSYS